MENQEVLKAIATLADKVSRYHERLLAVEREKEKILLFKKFHSDITNLNNENANLKEENRILKNEVQYREGEISYWGMKCDSLMDVKK